MPGTAEISGTINWTPSQVSGGVPSENTVMPIAVADAEYGTQMSGSLAYNNVHGSDLPLGPMTKGIAILYVEASNTISINVVYADINVAPATLIGNRFMVTSPDDDHRIGNIEVTGTAIVDYIAIGD